MDKEPSEPDGGWWAAGEPDDGWWQVREAQEDSLGKQCVRASGRAFATATDEATGESARLSRALGSVISNIEPADQERLLTLLKGPAVPLDPAERVAARVAARLRGENDSAKKRAGRRRG